MLGFIADDGSYLLKTGVVWGVFAGILAIIAVFYVLRSIGIYVLAKRIGFKNTYLAWIPFAWIYLLGKIAGDVTFFGNRFKNFTIFLTIVFCLAEAITLVESFLMYFPLVGYFLSGGEVYVASASSASIKASMTALNLKEYTGSILVGKNFVMPYANLDAVNVALSVFGYVNYVLEIVKLVFLVLAYSSIFRKYLPGHYFVATLFSAIGLFAPFIFAVRKNKAMNYQEYMRQKYANIYGNAYRQGGVSNQNYQQTKDTPDTPFSEFAEKGEVNPKDPFEEFSDNAKANDKDDPFDDIQ